MKGGINRGSVLMGMGLMGRGVIGMKRGVEIKGEG